MVVFTCTHCGESLQKPRVEKHYQTSCRNPISVTCMDCFKDFKLQEYADHSKCITEEQRYSAKGTVQGGAKKGERKQISWVAQINNILETQKNIKPNEKKLLDFISKNENVPRKKNKFINFMKSSSGGRVSLQEVEAVWGIIETQKENELAKKQKENGENLEENATANNVDKKSKKKKKTTEENVDMDSNKEVVSVDESSKKSKKKKRKAETDDNIENIKKPKEEEPVEKLTKKKKRKHDNDENKLEEIGSESDIPKKKKTKKVKNGIEEKSDETVHITENGKTSKKKKNKDPAAIVPDENGTSINGQSKKKKNKKIEPVDGEESITIDIKENGKLKKNKNKENQSADVADTSIDLDSSMNDFSWQRTILEVLKDKKTMLKHDLQKVVAKKFKKIRGEPPSGIQLKLFQRKLNKLKNVKVENDMVTLQTC